MSDKPNLSAFEQSARGSYAQSVQSWLDAGVLIQETSQRIWERAFGEVPSLPLRATPEQIWPLVCALLEGMADADLEDIDEC